MQSIALWTTASIPRGVFVTIPKDQQKIIWGDLHLWGRLTIQGGGRLVIVNGELIEHPGSLFVRKGDLIEFQCVSQDDFGALAQLVGGMQGDLTIIDNRVTNVEGNLTIIDNRVTTIEGCNSDMMAWLKHRAWGRN